MLRRLLIILLLFVSIKALGQQQDIDFHINTHLLAGIKILKVKRDFNDPYLWVLAENNQVFRINSETFAVNNYTSYFASYNNLQFIDIADHNQDSVYVATKSTTILACENGNLKTINVADEVNSIGFGLSVGYDNGFGLYIGTTEGLDDYNIKTNSQIYYGTYANSNTPNSGPVKVFAATYRSDMYTDVGWNYYVANDYPIIVKTTFNSYRTYINHPDSIQINTAFYSVSPTTSIYDESSFWGNSNGLYQENLHYDGDFPTDYSHFLNGINVNKIADILGLATFGFTGYNPQISKDNLLIGTDSGLYFSSSLYINNSSAVGPVFSLFHYNDLGNIAINDICVNEIVNNVPNTYNCENGVWLATVDGVYYITPDYAKYIDPNTRLNDISFTSPATADSTAQICLGSTAKLSVGSYALNGNSVQWQKNGQDIIGETGPTLAVTDSGEYNAVLYAPCENVHISSNHLKVSTLSAPVFTFDYPDIIQYCDSASTTLNVTYSTAYNYRWYKDGVLNGNTTSKLTVTQSGKYYVEVSACSGTWIASKQVEVDLVNLPQPNITGDKSVYCQSDMASLSANTVTDNSYNINWYRNNLSLPQYKNQSTIQTDIAGDYTVVLTSNIAPCTKSSAIYQLAFTPAPSFTFNYADELNYCAGASINLAVQGSAAYQYRWYKNDVLTGQTSNTIPVTQTGSYKVEVSACDGSWVPSKEVQVNFTQIAVPVINTDKPAYCLGDNATLSIAPAEATYTINWYRDNVLLPGNTNQTSLTTNIAGNYTVSLVNTVANTDGTICSQTSAVKPVAFNPKPVVSIQQINNTNLCQGQTVNLKAIYTDGTVKWSTGESSDQIAVNTTGTYTVTLTTPAGCMADTSINIAFLPNPVLSINDTTICTYKNQTVTLTAPNGFTQYSWNGQTGNQIYKVTQPQTVALTVTDANGCQASVQIHVTEQCPDVEIPNTFTPNGDGINDTWQVEGLDNTATINVFNRYGALVYQSKGNAIAWDGTYHGSKLPAGVYYYIIKVKDGKQTFSGSVTIIY